MLNCVSSKPGAGHQATSTAEKKDNLNGHTEISVEQIKTREQMYSFLNISTSISAHYAFFSGNANVNYESEGTFDESGFVFGVRGLTRYAEIGLLNPRLDPRAAPLIRNLPALYSLCGREWVSQERRGVQIAVIYTIKNVSQSQRSRLEAAMSAGLDGGPLFGGKLDARLTKILQQAFVSNYYTARVYAIGGGGLENFANMITDIEDPKTVIQEISAYIKGLKYENSVPMFFQTGLLEQFVAAEQGGKLVFDPVNRRLASLYVAYREYQARRAELWRYLNDDAQSLWESKIDGDAWARLKEIDSKLSVIEEKASYCKAAADIAQQLDARTHSATSPGTPPRRPGTPADTAVRDFLRSFSTGVSSRAVGQIANALTAQTSETAPPGDDCSKTQNAKDEPGLGASYLCQC